MHPSDEARLQQILFDTFGDKIRPGKVAQWIRLLDGHHINEISAAFDEYFRESRFPPAPNNIIERLNAKKRSFRTDEETADIIRGLPIAFNSGSELICRRLIDDHGKHKAAEMFEESYPGHGGNYVRSLQ